MFSKEIAGRDSAWAGAPSSSFSSWVSSKITASVVSPVTTATPSPLSLRKSSAIPGTHTVNNLLILNRGGTLPVGDVGRIVFIRRRFHDPETNTPSNR